MNGNSNSFRTLGHFPAKIGSGHHQTTIVKHMETDRNLGPQPIADVMAAYELSAHALVEASTEQLTHKMVSRATKGRRLTDNTKSKIIRALNAATGRTFEPGELFNY